MLTISLFRGTDENHKQLAEHVPQNPPKERQLLLLAVIHDVDSDPTLGDAKVMLYQETHDTNAYWIRKENSEGSEARTNFVETLCFTGAAALNGFEIDANMVLSRLSSKSSRLQSMCGEGC